MGWSYRGDGSDKIFFKTIMSEEEGDVLYWLGNELHSLSQ